MVTHLKPWADSETIRYLKSNPISGQIYSNEARAIYTHVDVSDEVEIRFNQLQTELPDEARYWDDSAHSEDLEMYVVWFHGWRPFIQTLYDFTQLISLLDLEIKMSLEDGIVLKAPKDITTHVDRKDTKKYIIESILDGAQLMASSRFKIYFKESRLIYVSTSCKASSRRGCIFFYIYIPPILKIYLSTVEPQTSIITTSNLSEKDSVLVRYASLSAPFQITK